MTAAGRRVVLEQPAEGVRRLRLVNPARRNAIDEQARRELVAAVGAVAGDAQARVLVVSAEGPAFCSGADLVDTFDGVADLPVAEVRDRLRRTYDSFLPIAALEIPTIAAVGGAAVGAGLNLALCCDVRLAGRAASFGAVFTRIGLHPGGGSSFFLTRIAGPQRALRILLDGETIDAEAAVALGIADRLVDDPDAVALETAERWARLDPDLSRSVKRSVRLAGNEGLAASVDFESWAQAASARRPQIQRVVERYRRQRPD